MSAIAALIILATTLVTSFISGIFGMAGGLILMAVLVALVSVAMAMIIHGAIQMFANGFRAFLLREHVDWRVFSLYCIGAGAGVSALFFVSWTPDKRALYLLLGLTPSIITDLTSTSAPTRGRKAKGRFPRRRVGKARQP